VTRPTHLNVEYASRFKARAVAEIYQHRPPYSAQVYETLRRLLPTDCRRVLDAGCGPGKIALGLVDDAEHVDAVDFSEAMIRIGRAATSTDRIRWQCSPIETAELDPPYGMITTGASLHWMDWDTVLPRFARVLPSGALVIVEGDGPSQAPWRAGRKELIKRYSTNRDYQPYDLVDELRRRGLFTVTDELITNPAPHTQSIDEFLLSEHSRESLSLDSMTAADAAAFDDQMRELLAAHAEDGQITYGVTTRIVWGRPAVAG
jgi:SAM-dependent methyltransferase